MLLRTITLLFFCSVFCLPSASAQNTWTLERCIEYARQNNLSVKQAEYTIQNNRLTQQQNQFSRLPNLSARTNAGLQFGRTIDPTTNTFNTERISFNTFSLDASATLYNGGRINNAIKQSKINLEASRYDAQATLNDIGLSIANAYLSILLAEEQLSNARQRLALSQEQLSQTDKLIQAGARPANERLDFLAQIALDEQLIIEADNLVVIGYLNLKQLLELDPGEELRIVRPESVSIPPAVDPRNFGLEETYVAALQTQPQIRAADLRLESAQLDENIAQAGYLPSLVLFAGMNTNFSSAFRSAVFGERRVPQTVFIDNTPVVIEFETQVPLEINQIPYGRQFRDNFGQSVGLSLGIPIYSNHQNRIAVERARLNVLNTQVANRQLRQQLKTEVQRAIADARAAREAMMAAQRTVEAAQMAFDNAEKRFQLGAINSLEYATSRNNLDRAQIDLIRSKYQYLFNLKVVDFYLGRPISLD